MSSSKEMLANKSDNNNIRQIESDKNSSNSKTLINFYPITKSMSVPDVNKNSPINSNNLKLETNLNDLLQTNSGSIESAIADSPAGSIEQFEATVNTPLSTDDPVDSLIDTLRDSQSNLPNNIQKKNDLNNQSFRFRRHSSQSAINLNSSLPNSSTSTVERICSSPINRSRICQIKIDEGIEPHLSREIKSEREMQNTLKLKTSCDELMLINDELSLESFENNRITNDQNRANSPVTVAISSTNPFRHNMPSPSLSSCYSYSNSSSPTAGLGATNNNTGLLRCFSPSLNTQNYFSQSPSPTRKLFVTRRSMSPVQFRPSTLTGNLSGKRKLSDIDSTDSNQVMCSPKRSNNEIQQAFAQPLQIFANNSSSLQKPIEKIRSLISSPTPLSPNQNSISSLSIASTSGIASNESVPSSCLLGKSTINNKSSFRTSSSNETSIPTDSTKILWPPQSITAKITNNTSTSNSTINSSTSKTAQIINEENSSNNKYTFQPIQLPQPTSFNSTQRKRLINTSINPTNSTFSTVIQQQTKNSPLNSPANYVCDSPISYSPSVSIISLAGEKPDSGYQSIQNNSDSE